MANYSATQVITPAIERTRQFLFRPFRLGRFLKLTLVAALVEAGSGGFNFSANFPPGKGGPFDQPFHLPTIHWPALLVLTAIVGVVLAVVIPIFIGIAYLLIRLRFSYFDCCLYLQDRIAPGWARYHRQTMRYLGLSLLVGLGFWVVLIAMAIGVYRHFKPLLDPMMAGAEMHFLDLLPMVGTVLLLVFLLAIAAYLVDSTMTCFVLPRMAIEDASIGDALADVWADLQAEPGPFALFLLFRALLSFAAGILCVLLLAVPLVFVVLVGLLIGLVLNAISSKLLIFLGVPAAILVGILILVAGIGLGGTVGTFRRNYALLFYGGRYPELAALLWPPPAPVPAAPVWQPEIPPSPSSSFEGS